MTGFLGTGARFPFTVDHRGWIATSSDEQDVEESIRIILFTAKQERVMRPDFGAGLPDYVFTTMSVAHLGAIQSAVFQALTTWEPRIKVLSVKVTPGDSTEGVLEIGVEYKIRSTNSIFNKVFPYKVEV